MKRIVCGIYAIYSTLDDSCLYVGQSKNIDSRFRIHIYKLKGKRTHALQDFIQWYHDNGANEDLIRLSILEECEDSDFTKNLLESKWFDKLQPAFYGKVPSLSESWKHSEETKVKIAEAIRNKNFNFTKNNKRINIKCLGCQGNTTSKTKFCKKCIKHNLSEEFDNLWFEKINNLYCESNLSIRGISEKLNLPRMKITESLKRNNVKILPRTFNGGSHKQESRDKIRESTAHNRVKQIKARVTKECQREGCSITKTYKPSDVKKFCSRQCYIFDQTGKASPKLGKTYK